MPRPQRGWPLVVLLLDGLADWPCPELGGRTPLEAAETPNLDRIAAEGANGIVYPLGPGRCPSSERAQWGYLGYGVDAFPGRAVLEARGAGIDVPPGAVVAYAALRSAQRERGRLVLQGWYREAEDEHCRALVDAVDSIGVGGITFRLAYLERGDAICFIDGATSAEVTDSDPFSTDAPVLAVRACAEARDADAAAATAAALTTYVRRCHELLDAHPVNVSRRAQGYLPLNTVVTKWTGRAIPLPPLERNVGGPATFVSSRGLYAGLARTVGARFEPVEETEPDTELARKVEVALARLAAGDVFAYVHTKAPDEAGHRHDPVRKRDVISALDTALKPLCDEPEIAVAVTTDHATPSWGPLLHSGDAVPLAVRAPTVRVDDVAAFGERAAAGGALGTLHGADLLPLLVNAAGRARFLGSRHGALATIAAATEQDALVLGDDGPQ